jgi:hypothetical protein
MTDEFRGLREAEAAQYDGSEYEKGTKFHESWGFERGLSDLAGLRKTGGAEMEIAA